jgi:hypothetical protein
MGSPLGDRKYDDFSFTDTDEYKIYRRKYVQFIKKYIEYIDVYANLDVINNAELTWENQKYMEARGLQPIPVWHFGCEKHWLDMYVRKGYDYIAIGGIVPNPPEVIIPGLDTVWNDILTDSTGMPIVKIHGFAITAPRLLTRYPWYSVDSASWVKFGKYGIVCIPKKGDGNGGYDYKKNAWHIVVSDRSPAQEEEESKHIKTLAEAERTDVLSYLHNKGYRIGKSEFRTVSPGYFLAENERFVSGRKGDPERDIEIIIEPGLCNDYRLRDEVNIKYYKDLEKSVPEWPWVFEPPVVYKDTLVFK